MSLIFDNCTVKYDNSHNINLILKCALEVSKSWGHSIDLKYYDSGLHPPLILIFRHCKDQNTELVAFSWYFQEILVFITLGGQSLLNTLAWNFPSWKGAVGAYSKSILTSNLCLLSHDYSKMKYWQYQWWLELRTGIWDVHRRHNVWPGPFGR